MRLFGAYRTYVSLERSANVHENAQVRLERIDDIESLAELEKHLAEKVLPMISTIRAEVDIELDELHRTLQELETARTKIVASVHRCSERKKIPYVAGSCLESIDRMTEELQKNFDELLDDAVTHI